MPVARLPAGSGHGGCRGDDMTGSRYCLWGCVAAALALTAFAARAQQVDLVVPPAAVSGAIAPADETFALFAASMSLAQIEGAGLVLKKGSRSDVREFAQSTVRVHTQA